MKKADLTQVKYIGTLRKQLLNDAGITTVTQLSEMPLEKLAQVKTVGANYAKLIKAAVKGLSEQKLEQPARKDPKTAADKKEKVEDLNHNLRKQIKDLSKHLTQAAENLKPLGKKKYLKSYVDLKKKSKTLTAHLNRLDIHSGQPSQKDVKRIIKNAEALRATLKNADKKPSKKKYRKISREIQLFSKMLGKARS